MNPLEIYINFYLNYLLPEKYNDIPVKNTVFPLITAPPEQFL